MNKTMLCIEILHLLSTKNIMSKNELADILEINPRNIIEYIKTLEDCGYEIESVRGIYGGYRLKKDSVLPVPKLSPKEIEVIKSSCSFLEHQSDFLEYKEYIKYVCWAWVILQFVPTFMILCFNYAVDGNAFTWAVSDSLMP